MSKILLVLVDGMRPDSLPGIPQAEQLQQKGTYANARTVFPSVTLPCHMSLFHSVEPQRHGTTTNIYTPQVRPIPGLCEALKRGDKRCAFFYNWEELRDLTRPDSLAFAGYFSGHYKGYETANRLVTDAAIQCIRQESPDFVFVYLGWVDAAGHDCGWMSEEYQRAVRESWEEIVRLQDAIDEDYTLIVTADHGGHDRCHGTDWPEDMQIPLFFRGPAFAAGGNLENASILDIAPTITALMGVETPAEWEGKSLL